MNLAYCITEAQKIFLNDSAGSLYTTAKLIPLGKRAYRDLQREMVKNGAKVFKEVSSGYIDVAAGATVLSAPPADLLRPIKLYERADGSSDTGSLMEEVGWDPNELQSSTLRKWVWREEAIRFLGATVVREVRVDYIKSLTDLVDQDSTLGFLHADAFMSPWIAAYVAQFMMNNPSRAEELRKIAYMGLETMLTLLVQEQQGVPIRRKGFRSRRQPFILGR